MSIRGKGSIPSTPEMGDHHHTTAQTDDPAAPNAYLLEKVDEADPAAVSQVTSGSILALETQDAREVWAYRGHARIGKLPSEAIRDQPELLISPQSFRAAVITTEGGDHPRILVQVVYG